MYNTGTVTATANSTKLIGTGTKWLNNINRVSAEQAIQIQIGATVHNNSIQSIQSDTELTLNFPLPTAATAAKYVILTTMVHSVSDAMNKIVSMNGSNVQFSDILTRWMTEQGIITVTLPDQTTQQLRTTKEMDKQLDGKFDAKGGTVSGAITAGGNLTAQGDVIQVSNTKNNQLIQLDTTNDNLVRINSRQKGGATVSHLFPTLSGTLMQVGDFGVGAEAQTKLGKDYRNAMVSYSSAAEAQVDGWPSNGAGFQSNYASNRRAQWFMNGAGTVMTRWTNAAGADTSTPWMISVSAGEELAQSTTDMENHFKSSGTVSKIYRNTANTSVYSDIWSPIIYSKVGGTWSSFSVGYTTGVFKIGYGDGSSTNSMVVYTTKNTTKDSNGNLKAASPIVKVFADDIDVNDESEGVTLKKLHTGIYQLCGVLGMHSDASWGGINGGITIPSGINQLPLVYVDYDVLVAGEHHPFNGEVVQQEEHGDIVIYTSYRKHLDLPQNVQYARLKAYPEFSREIDGKLVELEAGDFIDVPTGHWIDVRVNMPSDSLYNQKQAEAQRLAKLEAERLAKEEAERIAEEAERAEQEGQDNLA